MAVKNALAVKKRNPDANIYILYRDMRTYGFRRILPDGPRTPGSSSSGYNEEKPPVVSGGERPFGTVDSPTSMTVWKSKPTMSS